MLEAGVTASQLAPSLVLAEACTVTGVVELVVICTTCGGGTPLVASAGAEAMNSRPDGDGFGRCRPFAGPTFNTTRKSCGEFARPGAVTRIVP